MEPISLQLLARAAGDNAPHPGVVTQICTDTRQLTPGCLFVALQGERFDGHDFVPAALAGGAIAAVVHHPLKAPAKQLIQVEDTQRALLAMAACFYCSFRQHFIYFRNLFRLRYHFFNNKIHKWKQCFSQILVFI